MEPNYTMYLDSPSAVALWNGELCGQLSDGMWENARPFDHWKFWCWNGGCTYSLCTPSRIELHTYKRPKKVNYNFARLIPIVGERMLALGKMGAANPNRCDEENFIHAGEYMPPTLEEWQARKEDGEWEHSWCKPYMDNVGLPDAQNFYSSKYSMKDLRGDLKKISNLMKTVPKL